MKKIKVMTVFGTRPEAIKMAPLALELIYIIARFNRAFNRQIRQRYTVKLVYFVTVKPFCFVI